jgi:hypothetical protein
VDGSEISGDYVADQFSMGGVDVRFPHPCPLFVKVAMDTPISHDLTNAD